MSESLPSPSTRWTSLVAGRMATTAVDAFNSRADAPIGLVAIFSASLTCRFPLRTVPCSVVAGYLAFEASLRATGRRKSSCDHHLLTELHVLP